MSNKYTRPNYTGSAMINKDQILKQIDTCDVELDMNEVFTILHRSIIREDTVMIDRILDSKFTIEKYNESIDTNVVLYEDLIQVIEENIPSYDVFGIAHIIMTQ